MQRRVVKLVALKTLRGWLTRAFEILYAVGIVGSLLLLAIKFWATTYTSYGWPGIVATVLNVVPVVTGLLLRLRLYLQFALSGTDRRHLAELAVKTLAVMLVGLGLANLMLTESGPTEPILLASITAMAQWMFAAEALGVFLKYRWPALFGDDSLPDDGGSVGLPD